MLRESEAILESDTQQIPVQKIPHHNDADRSSISTAFVASGNDADLDSLRRNSSDTLLNQNGECLRPLVNGSLHHLQRYVQEKLRILLPVYNQEKDIGRTLGYLTTGMGIPEEHILASSGSTDRSDSIIQSFGVGVRPQYDSLHEYLNVDRFLEITKADDLRQLRGKGLTMFAGHLHRVLQGQTNDDTFTLQVDTDIKNIGTDEDQWDPVTYFAHHLQKDPDIDAIKAAKNGRNNQPMHIFFNGLPSVDDVGRHYQSVAMDRWILTGEYGWKSGHTERLRWATGYAIETVLAMSQVDLGMKRRQVEMPQPRTDGQNLLTKETVMYTDIQRTAIEIVRTGKKLHELSMSDIAAINARRQQQANDTMWMCHEKDANPGPEAKPNEPVRIQPSRLIPDIDTLIREGIVYSGN